MIKILHFVSTPAKWSGVMSVIMNYYRHIDRTRIQFEFLCFLPCEESYENEILSLGGKVHFVSKPSSLSAVRDISNFFKVHTNEYQWLHNHEVYLSFLLKPLAKHHGINHFIVHSHTTQYSDRPLPAFRNRFLCIPIQFMKCERFACSEAAGIFLFGDKKGLFRVMPNAIESKRFFFNPNIRESYRRSLNLRDEILLGHVGRFVPQKNHEFLLEFFYEFHKKEPIAHLLLIGDGPLKQSILRKAASLGLQEQVHFVGHRDDVENYLQAMDIFILPSLYEGLPMSCLEAQAAGLPCIISDAITQEVQLSNCVHRLPLVSTEQWVLQCLNYCNSSLSVTLEKRNCPDYVPDIEFEARKLSDYYEKRL